MAKPHYKRILLKLSGEALSGNQKSGLSPEYLQNISAQIYDVHRKGIQIGVVIGGGNIVRGLSATETGMERVAGDHMGMLATVINCIAMQNFLERLGAETRVMSALHVPAVAEPYIRRRAVRHLEKNRIVLFAAGTGNPYFTTDSAATLRAIETNCDIIMKGTKVDGIYDKDPAKHKGTIMFKQLDYTEVINRQLMVMDTSSIALCRENNMPILVFNMTKQGNLLLAASGKKLGTIVKAKEEKNG
ncbi:UMP kinase [Fibrobacterota bacterium]